MIAKDEDALVCDLAETYHVFDYKALPPKQAAVFAVGLSNDSRIKRSMSGQKHTSTTLLLAAIADGVNILAWQRTKDGQRNTNRPDSILKAMTEEEKDDLAAFDSIAEYETARANRMEC